MPRLQSRGNSVLGPQISNIATKKATKPARIRAPLCGTAKPPRVASRIASVLSFKRVVTAMVRYG